MPAGVSIRPFAERADVFDDPTATVAFGLHLAKTDRTKAKKKFRPPIDRAVRLIQSYLRKPDSVFNEVLQAAFDELQDSQNEIKHHRWADVRMIHSKEALLAEYTLECVRRPWNSVHWGHRLATVYAERYDPRYGTGLIPTSASAVEDIAAFWAKHFRVRSPRRAGAKRAVKAKAGGASRRAPKTSE